MADFKSSRDATGVVDERYYVIYWPEDTTWDDSAASPVCRNRVTFMRSVISIHPFHISFRGSGTLLKYATKLLLYYPTNTQQISYGMTKLTRKAILNPLMDPPANLIGYIHLRSLKRMNKRRMQFRTLVFRCSSFPFCKKLHLTCDI